MDKNTKTKKLPQAVIWLLSLMAVSFEYTFLGRKYIVGIIMYTPEIAQEILDTAMYKDNRKLRWEKIREFVADTLRGQWFPFVSLVVFSPEGIGLDCQHRMHVIVESKKPMPYITVIGVPKEHIAAIDRNSKRTTKDKLRMIDHIYTTSAAISSTLIALLGITKANPKSIDIEGKLYKFVRETTELVESWIVETTRAPLVAVAIKAVLNGTPVSVVKSWVHCATGGEIGPIPTREELIAKGTGGLLKSDKIAGTSYTPRRTKEYALSLMSLRIYLTKEYPKIKGRNAYKKIGDVESAEKYLLTLLDDLMDKSGENYWAKFDFSLPKNIKEEVNNILSTKQTQIKKE